MGADASVCDHDGNNVLPYILTAWSPFHIATLKSLSDYDINVRNGESHFFENIGFVLDGLHKKYFPQAKYNMLITAIKHGATVRQKNIWGWTPMTYACCRRVFKPAADDLS